MALGPISARRAISVSTEPGARLAATIACFCSERANIIACTSATSPHRKPYARRPSPDGYGMRHGPPEVMARLAQGEIVDPSEYYFRVAPMFETGAERYAWLNNILAVGVGERLPPNMVRYSIFEIL